MQVHVLLHSSNIVQQQLGGSLWVSLHEADAASMPSSNCVALSSAAFAGTINTCCNI
jgi:hypothetical protein